MIDQLLACITSAIGFKFSNGDTGLTNRKKLKILGFNINLKNAIVGNRK